MADRVRRIVLSVQDEFSGKLKRYSEEIAGAERATKSFSDSANRGGGLRGFNEQLHYTLQNAQQLYTAFNTVFSTANQWAQMGLGAERSQIALRGLTDESEKYIEAIQLGTMGAVTQGEAAAQAYRLIKFGLADSAAEAEKFIHTMTIVAAINPQLGGTSEAINQIQLTLSNMSFMRLDQLGISAGKVRQRMAELKDETAGLSNEQAFQTAVMEQLDAQAVATGDSILGLSDAQDRFRARIRGFKEDIGKEIAEGFEGAATAGEALIGIWNYFDTHPFSTGGPEAIAGKMRFEELLTEKERAAYMWMSDEQQQDMIQSARQRRRQQNAAIAAPVLPPALMNQYGFMAQAYEQEHVPTEAPDYYSRWAQETPYAYGGLGYQRRGPTIPGAGRAAMGEIWQGMYGAQRAGEPLLDQFFQTATQGARALRGELDSAGSSIAGMVAQADAISFESLDEKFGIDPANFDVDVFNEMKDALGEAGVETDIAAEAMRRYELATGIATGSSEVFAGQMDTLAQQLAEGKISAEEYVDSVTELSQADYSWLDRLIKPLIDEGDLDMAQRYIDIVGQMGSLSWTAPGLATPELGVGAEMGIGEGGGGVPGALPSMAATPLGEMMMEYDALTQKFASAETDMSDPVGNAMEKNQKYFSGFEEDAIRNIDNVESAFLKLNGLSVNMNANVTYTFGPRPPAGPEGTPATGPIELPEVYGGARGRPGNLPEFQHGGAVRGRGMVDPGEYVVPVGGALVLRDPRGGWSQGGGGGTTETHITKLFIRDQEVAEAVEKYQRRNNDGK